MSRSVSKGNNTIRSPTKLSNPPHSPDKASVRLKKQQSSKETGQKYKVNAITKQNFDVMTSKGNITQLVELPLKYVLKCVQGLYKNRFLFITTHPEGQIFGSGDAKLYGLTLQIEGVGLSAKHAQLRYDGFKSFNVCDFGSQNGTWMNIPKEGVEIKDGQFFTIGPHLVSFNFAEDINQIEEICIVYHMTYLSDVLEYNGITNLHLLYAAYYNNFDGYPFDKKQLQRLKRICDDSKNWYQQGKKYRRVNINYLNEPLKDLSIQIGWQPYIVSSDPQFVFTSKNQIAEVNKGRLIPQGKVFSKLKEGKTFPLSLHSQIKIGNLSFELTRFNSGFGIDIGFRPSMEDGLLIEQDVGGSQWKLISLFAVLDGHGGVQCMQFVRDNLINKIRAWTKLLDEAGDLNQMIKVLMNKTFFEIDYQFYQKYPELSKTCGCTALILIIIESRVYVFHVGDCKAYLFRDNILYQLNIDHIPSRGDERNRIQNAGGFIQYDRLMGKCTLSRCLGQFEYKSVQDYEGQMKGKLKSFLSCIPDVVAFDLVVDSDDFIFISTDGIIQGMTISQITDFIKERYDKLEMEQNPNKIISSIIQHCKITQPECDNMAAILLIIKKGLVGGKSK